MKRSPLACFVLLVLVGLGAGGCASLRHDNRTATSNRPRSFALAVTVHGTMQPTPEQWAMIQARFAKALAARGWVLVSDVSLADHILRVDFTPDADDPDNNGTARIVSVRRNPLSTVARQGMSPYPSSTFGYSSAFMSGWPQSNYYSAGYYGYSDYYQDGYYWGGSTTYTPVTTVTTTTHHHHPPGTGTRDDCPPPMVAVPPLPGQFTGSDPINDHPRPPPRDYGRMAGEYVPASHSNRSSSWSGSSYSRSGSDSSYFPSNSSSYSSSSYSSPSYESYSPPSSSYSADTSSSAASSATTASIGSSAPSVGSVSSAH